MRNKKLHNPATKAKTGRLKKYPYLVTGEELLLHPIKQLPCLWEPYFPQQGVISLTGASDVGKTSFLRQFAISTVLKESNFLGNPLNVRYGRVLYLVTEDSKLMAQVSLQKSVDTATVKPSQLQGLGYMINPDNPFSAIEEQLKVAKTDVVIIDSFGDVVNGNLNDNNVVRTFLNKYQKLSEKYDTLFVFLHHTGKRTENGNPSKNNVIGSQGFEAKMRLVMELRKPDNSNRRDLYFTKGNCLSEKLKSQPLQLMFDSNQKFHLIGNTVAIPSMVRVFPEDVKQKIIADAKKLRQQNMSFDKILIELKNKGFEKIPSKGALVEWLTTDSGQSS